MNKFIFNRRDSYEDMNCIIVAPIKFPAIREDVENRPIDGRKTGTVTIKTGNYKDTIISIAMQLNNMEDYKVKMLRINEWLENIVDYKLFFEDYPEKCYIVKNVNIQDFTNEKVFYSRFNIEFVCEPFMRLRNERFQTINKNEILKNNGNVDSEPFIKLSLPSNNQNIQITINNNTFQINSVNGNIEIDSQLQTIKGNQARIRTIGDFPILEKGNNLISWTGIINKFEINKRLYFKG